MREPAGASVDLSDIPNTGKASWAKLVGDADPPEVARRHVVDGIKRLRRLDLVHLGGPASRNAGFSQWGLLCEDGSGRPYRVASGGVRVPVEFWTSGWAQVLTPTEILAYLMVRHLAQAHPVAHSQIGVGAAPAVRRQRYGVTKTAYAALNELEELGLLRRTTPRHPRGLAPASPREVDRFQLTSDGIARGALERAKTVFTRHETPIRISQYDPGDALLRALEEKHDK
jgi:hypothetical protein